MAYITEFSITELAGRDTVYEKTLNRDTNIFFGLNGSGKTSLLKILGSAINNDASMLRNVPFKKAEVKIYSIDYKKTFIYTIDQITRDETNSDTLETHIYRSIDFEEREDIIRSSKLVWKISPRLPKSASGRWVGGYLPTSRFYKEFQRFRSREYPRLSDELLDEYFAQALEELWTRYYAGVLVAVRKAQEDGLASIMKAVLSTKTNKATKKSSQDEVQDVHNAYKRVTSFLKRQGSPDILGSLPNFEKRYENNAQLRSVVSDIDRVEREIEKATAPVNDLQNLILKMFSGNKTIRFEDTKLNVVSGKTNIGLQSLSSGEKQVLRIFIEVLRIGDNCIIIDEPELSLHVDWQNELIADLRLLNPKAQLILATHSPEIMANVDDSKIFKL